MKRPRPSIEIVILAASSLPVKAALVNCAPWSVLNIPGFSLPLQGLVQGVEAEARIHRIRRQTQRDQTATRAPPGGLDWDRGYPPSRTIGFGNLSFIFAGRSSKICGMHSSSFVLLVRAGTKTPRAKCGSNLALRAITAAHGLSF
jgi:hypothetical protein